MSVATAENGKMTSPAPDKPPESKPLTPFQKTKGWLQSNDFKTAVAAALPKHMTPDRFLRIALTAVMKTPKLAQCTQESVFNCLLQLSQYGLEPDGRRAHLIPFDVKKKQGNQWVVDHTDCTLIIDFKGYAELVMRSGLVSSIHADIVCDNDDFDYDRGFITRHKINFKESRGKAYAAYAVVRFKDGTEKCEVMTKEDIYAIRDRSQGWKSFTAGYAKQSPWDPAEPVIEHEMWKKTVFRRITKWVPLSAEIRDALANEEEEEVRLIDLRERNAAVEVQNGSKSDSLVSMMQQRLESQQSADEGPQDEPPNNGEESQETPEPNNLEAEIAQRMLKDISIAAVDRLMSIEQQAGGITDDGLRTSVYDAITARRAELKKLGGGKSNGGGKLPGTE